MLFTTDSKAVSRLISRPYAVAAVVYERVLLGDYISILRARTWSIPSPRDCRIQQHDVSACGNWTLGPSFCRKGYNERLQMAWTDRLLSGVTIFELLNGRCSALFNTCFFLKVEMKIYVMWT